MEFVVWMKSGDMHREIRALEVRNDAMVLHGAAGIQPRVVNVADVGKWEIALVGPGGLVERTPISKVAPTMKQLRDAVENEVKALWGTLTPAHRLCFYSYARAMGITANGPDGSLNHAYEIALRAQTKAAQ